MKTPRNFSSKATNIICLPSTTLRCPGTIPGDSTTQDDDDEN